MNQIKNGFSSIEQMTTRLLQQKPARTENNSAHEESFEQILLKKEQAGGQDALKATGLKFSRHANERILNRSIDLSEEQIKRLEAGVSKAQAKGIVESLVMVDSYAFIVNTRNNVVVTALAGNEDRVFTNIDGAVIS